jgi:hypothetical protein
MLHALFQVDQQHNLTCMCCLQSLPDSHSVIAVSLCSCHGEEAMLQQMAPSAVGRRLITSHNLFYCVFFSFKTEKKHNKNNPKHQSFSALCMWGGPHMAIMDRK